MVLPSYFSKNMFTVATPDNVDHEDHSTPSVANSNYGTAMTPFQINKIL